MEPSIHKSECVKMEKFTGGDWVRAALVITQANHQLWDDG